MKRSTLLVSACLSAGIVAPYLLLCSTGLARADEPLKGCVEETGIAPTPRVPAKVIEPMPVPVVRPRKTMQKARVDSAAVEGRLESTQLDGKAEDAGADLKAVEGKPDPQTGRLKATVSKDDADLASQDPDAADRELMIEWDRWRNRFLHAIQSGMQEKLNEPSEANLRWDPSTRMMVSRFPLGTVAWFACQVTPDRRIVNARILHTSGFPAYDRAVLNAIHDLEGSSILRYPRGSRRKIVSQVAGIKTAETSEFRYHKFGDVEKHFLPGD